VAVCVCVCVCWGGILANCSSAKRTKYSNTLPAEV